MSTRYSRAILFALIVFCGALALFGCSQSNNTSTDTSADTSAMTEIKDDGADTGVSTDTTVDTNAGDTGETEELWNEDGALKILTIGNSFSDDTMQYAYQIAQELGIENIVLGNLYIGGCSLDTHAANAKADNGAYEYRTNTKGTWSTVTGYKMSDAIKSQNWDFISLQQASSVSGLSSSYGQLSYLIGYVKNLCPDAKIVWNMTWAYQQNSTHSGFAKYNNDQTTMYNAILSAVDKNIRTRDDIYTVSPTGTAIQNARSSYVGDRLTRDGYHLTYDLGRYVAGLTFIGQLTGLSIENVTYLPDGVDENLRAVAIESATNAIKTPTKQTESNYKTEPGIDYSKYTKLEISWTAHGYWHSSHATNHHIIVTTASNSNKFYASPMFTREDIPVGSIIELSEGWQYRPEAWKSSGVQSSRPGITSLERVVVTEAWWGDYTHRAFNLSKVGSPVLSGNMTEIEGAITIWIPKN